MATNPTEKLEKLPSNVWVAIGSQFGDKLFGGGQRTGAPGNYSVVVGQLGQHSAISNAEILAVQWVVPATGAPMAGYALSKTAGTPMPLPQALTFNPIYFAWTVKCATFVGAYITTAYGTAYAENYFYVEAPVVASFAAVTGVPSVGLLDGHNYLRFGVAPANGITISATVNCQQGVSGTIAMIQLANNQRFMTDTDGTNWRWSINGLRVLDVGPSPYWLFYQDETSQIGSQQSGQIQIADAPATELGPPKRMVAIGDGNPVVPESYQTYLMFRCAQQGSIWVALGMLAWSWEGYSELENGNWSPVQQPGNTVNPQGAPLTALPSWSSNSAGGQWVQAM